MRHVDTIRERLLALAEEFVPTEEEQHLSMHTLISMYNERYDNPDLIGGSWVREHVPELAELP